MTKKSIAYRPNHRREITIDGVSLKLAPLTYLERMELTSTMQNSQGEQLQDMGMFAFLAVKMAVKEMKGLCYEGSSEEVKLEFEDEDKRKLTDDCANTILMADFSDKVITTVSTLIAKFNSKEIINPQTGKPMEGIKIKAADSKDTKKK